MTTGQSDTAAPRAGAATSAAGPIDRRSGRLPRRLQAGVRAIDHRLGRLRALLRADEIAFVALAVLVGAGAGFAVTVMSRTTQLVHELLFAIAPGARLSASSGLEAWRVLPCRSLGGLLLGAVMSASGRFRSPAGASTRSRPTPSTAAGCRCSTASGVGLETMISNGAGASVGLEAGYTQVGSGVASTLGERFRLRRNDLRMLVGCGAAGAIAAAFAAPLTGAFYAFELVIGGYTVAGAGAGRRRAPSPAPAVARLLAAQHDLGRDRAPCRPTWQDQLLLLLLGGARGAWPGSG